MVEKLADLRPAGADVEAEGDRLLDRVVVTALLLTEPAQDLQLVGDLGRERQVAGVGIARDQRQRPPLAAARDQDRRMRAAMKPSVVYSSIWLASGPPMIGCSQT